MKLRGMYMQYIKGIENYQNKNKAAITLGKFD